MTRPACGAPLERGGACQAFALPSGRCWNHDPARAAERRAARARGGKVKALHCRRLKLDNPQALVKFVGDVVQDTLSGVVEPDVARAVLYGCSIQRRLLEASDLERRLLELERRLAAREEQHGRR